jgi:tripartite-type tricarboxylate transporter receptor subunit TctC
LYGYRSRLQRKLCNAQGDKHPIRKQLKIIAISSPDRLKTAPEIPTLKEMGLNFVRFGWLGICAAAGTPQPIIDLLNRSITSIVDTPEYRSLIENAGSIAIASTPSELNRVMIQTYDETAATIREFGLQVE